MVERADWQGRVSGRANPATCLGISMIFPERGQGGSMALPVLATDGQRWWVKPLSNPQGQRVTINEYIVGRIGNAIAAPTCEVSLIEIGPDHVGYEITPGRALEAGYAYCSADVPDVYEVKSALAHRLRDDNRSRHAGVYALWDLCFGSDPQWLHQKTDDERIFSHDHGHYFPSGPDWTVDSLNAHVGEAHPLPDAATDLLPDAVNGVAGRVEALSAAAILPILLSIPAGWPIEDEALEALGWFIEERSGPVAQRLRTLVTGGSSGS